MHEQSPSGAAASEQQRIAQLHFRIADFIDVEPFAPELTGAIQAAEAGHFAALGHVGGEFILDNTDSRRTPLDNRLATMHMNAGFRDVQNALNTITAYGGPMVAAHDFNNPTDDTLRRALLAGGGIFAVSHGLGSDPVERARTLWVPMFDIEPDGSASRPLPLYRRITGPVYYDHARPVTLLMGYVILPYLQIPETAQAGILSGRAG